MAQTKLDRFRQLIGEVIPPGGTEADTLFTNEQVSQILFDSGDNMNRAVYEGWRIKAAHLANLVDVTDGNASREMSQLLDHAQDMIRIYSKSSGSYLTEGRTRVGRIVRRE